jgi:hypothetical protein
LVTLVIFWGRWRRYIQTVSCEEGETGSARHKLRGLSNQPSSGVRHWNKDGNVPQTCRANTLAWGSRQTASP